MLTLKWILPVSLSFSCLAFAQGPVQATDYLVFSTGSIQYSGSDFQGLTGALANVDLSHFQIQEHRTPHGVNLIAGKNVSLRSGAFENGGIEAGGNLHIQNAFVNGPLTYGGKLSVSSASINGSQRQARVSDVTNLLPVAQFYLNQSLKLGDLPANSQSQNEGGELLLNAAPTGVAVFSLDADSIRGLKSIFISAEPCTQVVINIHGQSAALQDFDIELVNGMTPNQVLFNFPDAYHLGLSAAGSQAYGIPGTVLAPQAETDFSNGRVTGGLYVGDLYGNGQVNSGAFDWSLSGRCANPLPPPAPKPD